jgi:putative nucleotidyltransferase with HDIG domain
MGHYPIMNLPLPVAAVPDDNDFVREIIGDMSVLVSPPDVCLRVTEMVVDDRASADQFAEVILRDPSLAARVLKLVNSSYFGLRSKVDTISRAVSIIGMNELTNIVYSLCAVQKFSRLSSRVTNVQTFWRHSVYCGLVAKALAERQNSLHPERLFVAGLLHDIGTLAINARFPEQAEHMIITAAGDEGALAEQEIAAFGIDHAGLSAIMLKDWNLPEPMCDAIRYHHAPAQAQVTPFEAALLNIGDTLANYSGTGSFSETIMERDDIDESVVALSEIPADFDRDEILDEVDRQFVETIYLLVA